MDITFHRATSATAEIQSLGIGETEPGRPFNMGCVLRIRVQRQGEREPVELTIFGEGDELRAICAAIGAAAAVVHEPVGGAS